jgi:hypothetical protein
MAAMVKPRNASSETSLLDVEGVFESVMKEYVGSFSSFVAVLNYEKRENLNQI